MPASVFTAAAIFIVSAQAQTVPTFSQTLATNVTFTASSVPINYTPNTTGAPPIPTGPPEATNATLLQVLFLSNSLGNTNLSDATAQTGFNINGASTNSIPGIVSPPANPNTNNLYYAAQSTFIASSNNSAWLGVNFVPGTNTSTVTNYLQLIAVNGNYLSGTNWAVTNLDFVVRPKQTSPPWLEVRFYNSSTNTPDNVYILPASTSYGGAAFGDGFWWSNSLSGSNNWANWIATSNQWTVRLSDIGVSGTNAQGKPYYAIRTTNFPNAAWYLSYGGGMVASTNMARPSAGSPQSTWFGAEWAPFELTLSGNPADKCDTTYINEFSIPMTVRALTNDYANSAITNYPTNSLAFYQIGGWTNWASPSAVTTALSNLVRQLTIKFANAVITNASGVPVMVAGPSAAVAGTLVAPQFSSPPYISDAQNSFPKFTAYFDAVKAAQPGRKAKIKDFIGASGSPNGTNGNNPTFFFYYDFDLEVTANNALRLTGSLTVTNQPGSTATYTSNVTDLVLEIGADAGPNDNWASSAVYLAPTPANFVAIRDVHNLTNGSVSGTYTNVQAYSPYASNGLAGANITIAGTNLLGAVQVAFSGPDQTLVPSPLVVATNDTNITAVVPYGAVNGPIVVTTTNGSGISGTTNNWFYVTGATNTNSYTNPVSGGPSAPVITNFTPTNGQACVPAFTISGSWFQIAKDSGTGPTNANPSVSDYYNSTFGTAIMGRIMGDLAAGFALGFINSTNINPYYGTNVAYGDSPSGSWWGGNQYPAADANGNSYVGVNTSPQLSQWGNLIHQATAVTYGHPIYDRMQYFSGTNPLQIQPSSATNNNPDIWVVEVEFFSGMSSVGAAPAPPLYLPYSTWAATWLLSGTNTAGTADPDNDGFDNNDEYAFGGNPTNPTPYLLNISGSNISYLGLNNAGTNYSVQNTTNLLTGPWTNYTATVNNSINQTNIPLPSYYQRKEFAVPLTGKQNFYRVIFTNQ